ncbi:MAG: hypothetical protein GY930_11130, partial [bacterium]|nr:hypothetical protein [bacterium]
DANGISKGSAHVFEFDQGSTYCTGFWNSFVSMRMTGRLLASENRLSVLGSGFVPGQVALLLAATDSGYVVSPGGSLGSFCLGGQLARVSPGVADASGDLFFTVNTQAVPTNPAVAILPGETWYFQIWYRDQLFGASALFSEAIQVDFE